MNETIPISLLEARDCKFVRLQGGNADGITTTIHKLATFQQRVAGLYAMTKRRVDGMEVFSLVSARP